MKELNGNSRSKLACGIQGPEERLEVEGVRGSRHAQSAHERETDRSL
jgi:hypothetical protein